MHHLAANTIYGSKYNISQLIPKPIAMAKKTRPLNESINFLECCGHTKRRNLVQETVTR